MRKYFVKKKRSLREFEEEILFKQYFHRVGVFYSIFILETDKSRKLLSVHEFQISLRLLFEKWNYNFMLFVKFIC